MATSERVKRDLSRDAADRYLRDPDRFAETHDPEALARQIPLKAKTPRPADQQRAEQQAGDS